MFFVEQSTSNILTMSDKKIQLKPSHYHFFWWYFTGFLLLAFFGVGLVILYVAYRKQSAIFYKISDYSIIKSDSSDSETVDIANIQEVTVHQRWIDKKFNLGNLILSTETKQLEMAGIKDPHSLSSLILKAAEAEKLRLSSVGEIAKTPSKDVPESLDRLDYLTGLWQQGLLTDEDFKKEKRHFES